SGWNPCSGEGIAAVPTSPRGRPVAVSRRVSRPAYDTQTRVPSWLSASVPLSCVLAEVNSGWSGFDVAATRSTPSLAEPSVNAIVEPLRLTAWQPPHVSGLLG